MLMMGLVISGITAGVTFAIAGLLAGHGLMMIFGFYVVGGICGVAAFLGFTLGRSSR